MSDPTLSLSFSRNEIRSFPVPVTVNDVSCHDVVVSPLPLRVMVPRLVPFQKTVNLLLADWLPAPGDCWNESV